MNLDNSLTQMLDKPWAEKVKEVVLLYAVPVGGKVIGAILLWIIGRMVISTLQRVTRGNLEKRKLDITLVRYVNSIIGVALTILLLIAMLSLFGVETASFAGVLAAVGVAIGMAWSGLLSNFAAGVFMMILRPFKVGDMITAAGVTGSVVEIGLFATTIDTGDNIRNFVGNSKIFGDTIQNYTTNDYRRVDLKAQLAHGVDAFDAMARLRARLPLIKNVVAKPAPSVEILEFSKAGPVLAVRPYCHNEHYWDVYFATNAAIVEEFTKANYPVAEEHLVIRSSEFAAQNGAKVTLGT